MKSKILTYGGIFSFGVIFQMIVNLPNRPWFEDGHIYAQDVVVYMSEENTPNDKFYSFCKEGKVLYVKDESHVLVEWKKCQDMPFEHLRDGFLDLHSAKTLKLKH